MARTPLLNKLVGLSRLAQLGEQESLDYAAASARLRSRREVLQVLAAGAAMAAAPLAEAVNLGGGNGSARVAIVGGGLAGLACAYELRKAGLLATVYEGSARLGGRCFSNRSSFPGQVAENGGELIDTYHVATLRLAGELGLQLDDLLAYDAQAGGEDFNFLAGQSYSVAAAYNDFKAIQKQLNSEVAKAPFPTLWNSYTQRGWELDHMSIVDWINAYVPGGSSSQLGRLIDVAYVIEYGVECQQQSALNLIYLLGYSPQNSLQMFGESDERYHIRGGNDQLVSRMAATLSSADLRLEHELKQIVRNSDGSYRLSLLCRGATVTASCDHLVLALPFSILRHSVDYSQAGFDSRKRLAIETMPMGNSSKFQLQFKQRSWRQQGCNGVTYSDTGYQNTWEVTRAQAGSEGILNNFTGGLPALAMNNKPIQQKADEFLQQLELLLPGIRGQWNGKAILNYWPGNKWSRGGYGYYAPGNYTAFVGYEATRQGNCHFCGEHTSIESQGYLNGAIETGQRCASEIVADLKGH